MAHRFSVGGPRLLHVPKRHSRPPVATIIKPPRKIGRCQPLHLDFGARAEARPSLRDHMQAMLCRAWLDRVSLVSGLSCPKFCAFGAKPCQTHQTRKTLTPCCTCEAAYRTYKSRHKAYIDKHQLDVCVCVCRCLCVCVVCVCVGGVCGWVWVGVGVGGWVGVCFHIQR